MTTATRYRASVASSSAVDQWRLGLAQVRIDATAEELAADAHRERETMAQRATHAVETFVLDWLAGR